MIWTCQVILWYINLLIIALANIIYNVLYSIQDGIVVTWWCTDSLESINSWKSQFVE